MKRKVTLSVLAILIATLIMTGYTYAYYKANVNNINQTQTAVKSNELGLIYTGISEITAENMIPGDAFTKTFSVKNTSSVEVSYNIYMENIINEFNEDLVYTLSNENGIVIEETKLPETNENKTYLKSNISINPNETHNYILKIEYKYLDTPQNENQGSTFSATVGIDAAQNKEEDVKIGGTLMATSYNSTDAFWNYRGSITKVVFENKLVPKENAIYSFDVSEEQNGSVMSYLVANEDNASKYTLYIQSNGKIMANTNSSYLFCNFQSLKAIEGLEYLDTSNVTTMLDMFYYCFSLTNIDLSTFNTSNVTDMGVMFYHCTNLTNIDLSNFNTGNVTNMRGMFGDCSHLTNLNLNNFNTSNVTNMKQMFSNCSRLTSLDIANFDMNNVTEYEYMFSSMPNSALIYVKDVAIQQKVLSSGNRPASWTTDNVIVAS